MAYFIKLTTNKFKLSFIISSILGLGACASNSNRTTASDSVSNENNESNPTKFIFVHKNGSAEERIVSLETGFITGNNFHPMLASSERDPYFFIPLTKTNINKNASAFAIVNGYFEDNLDWTAWKGSLVQTNNLLELLQRNLISSIELEYFDESDILRPYYESIWDRYEKVPSLWDRDWHPICHHSINFKKVKPTNPNEVPWEITYSRPYNSPWMLCVKEIITHDGTVIKFKGDKLKDYYLEEAYFDNKLVKELKGLNLSAYVKFLEKIEKRDQ